MNKKQIIIDYEEYLEMEEKIKRMVDILAYAYFTKDNDIEKIKEKIERLNKEYWLFV